MNNERIDIGSITVAPINAPPGTTVIYQDAEPVDYPRRRPYYRYY